MLNTDSKIDPNSAGKNPVIPKPATIAATNHSIKAFMTKVRSPNVNKFSGSVKIKTIGLINILTKPITNETINAVPKPVIVIPGTSIATSNNDAASSTHLKSKFNIFFSRYYM